jgi:hypothetical protein
MCVCVCVCVCVCMIAYIYLYMSSCIHIYVCVMRVDVCKVCACVFTYRLRASEVSMRPNERLNSQARISIEWCACIIIS